jgi:glycosyltransferase involved in cell wall biosynthesis
MDATPWQRQRMVLLDRARNHERLRSWASLMTLPLAIAGPAQRRLSVLDRFLRFNPGSPLAGYALQKAVLLSRNVELAKDDETLNRSIILKPPGPNGEMGYLLTSFENELDKLARSPRLMDIQREYDIVFLATWQPFYSLPLYTFMARADRRLLLMPSSLRDYELCRDTRPDLVALPFQASSWVHPRDYREPPAKDIDIIMVANFSPYKRHWLLFQALRQLPKDLRVVLVGVPLSGRTRETLLQEARLFGTEDRVEIYESPPNATVADLLSRAKIFLGLSAREGSYIAVTEALFSNTPVGLYRNAIVGSKDHVNEHTGTLFDPHKPLAGQILEFLERAGGYRPAEWARANISSVVNSSKLNGLLRDVARSEGKPWTRDIEPFHCKHFEFLYEDEGTERLYQETYEDFRKRFRMTIARPKTV